jgi:hypothetical protein
MCKSFIPNSQNSSIQLPKEDIEAAAIEGAVHRLRPKLMTVTAVLWSLVPILWESGIGSDLMKPIAAPIVGGMITSTIHVLILVPVFFVVMKERALRRGTLIRTGGLGFVQVPATRILRGGADLLDLRGLKRRCAAGKSL